MRSTDCEHWVCGLQRPWQDTSLPPFEGQIWGETPAIDNCATEIRRSDVGVQKYGGSAPAMGSASVDLFGLVSTKKESRTPAGTSHGPVILQHTKRDLGFLPTADAVLFLRHEYQGSRAPKYPQRYYPI